MVPQLIKKKKKNRQQYSSQKLSKTVQNLLQHDGKKKYEVQKYTDSIENHFYVTINVDDNALHPECMCQMNCWISEQFSEMENYHQAYNI